MANLFFRTNVAPYRIDTYNALHEEMGFELYFLYNEDSSQTYDMEAMYRQCRFTPHICRTFSFLHRKYKVCTEIGRLIKTHQPDIVIVPEFKILTLQILLYRWLHRKKFSVISMCDDSYDMIVNNNDFSKLHKWARRLVVPRLDDLLLVDNKVVEWYQKEFRKGTWLPIIRDEKKEEQAYRKALPISLRLQQEFALQGQRILLYVGRLAALKNVLRVIEAINQCQEKFTFVIVGEGEEKSRWEKAALHCNHRVLFAGHYEGDEIRAWYNLADAFILPSWQEAYGAVTNEALIAGCQCIISSRCGSACLVNEHNGVLIDPLDKTDISNKIDNVFRGLKANNLCERKGMMTISFSETINNLKEKLKLTCKQ